MTLVEFRLHRPKAFATNVGHINPVTHRKQLTMFPQSVHSQKTLAISRSGTRHPEQPKQRASSLVLFESGSVNVKFTGNVTSRLFETDVRTSHSPLNSLTTYQIYQGRMGNHTPIFNHSWEVCAEFQRFIWTDMQMVVLVSRGSLSEKKSQWIIGRLTKTVKRWCVFFGDCVVSATQ
jgi:hypothetical protein